MISERRLTLACSYPGCLHGSVWYIQHTTDAYEACVEHKDAIIALLFAQYGDGITPLLIDIDELL